jgi:hypothetical protein
MTQQSIRHSSENDDWQTPPLILRPAVKVLDGIDVDPASSREANRQVRARVFFTPRHNGLRRMWCLPDRLGQDYRPVSIWLNPPGGWIDGKVGDSQVKRWWNKLLDEREQPYFGHALFLSFSIETMQNTQVKCQLSVLDFLTCVFSRRVAFIDGRTGEKVAGMTHSTCITYLPGRIDRTAEFVRLFSPMGKLVVPYRRRLVKAA